MNNTLVKKLDVELSNTNLPVLDTYNVSYLLNATLVANTSFVGNNMIRSADFANGTKFAFIFYVDESVVSRYRMYNNGGIPLVSPTSYYNPNTFYEVSASEIRENFFSAAYFGPLVNDPNPLNNGTGVFEIYAVSPE